MMAIFYSSRDLNILIFNVNGILRQKEELCIFLYTHDIDVALISGVKLSEDAEFFY